MAYTLAGGFVLGSLFNYISASAFVFTGHFGLSATQFSYLFAGNSVALVLGGMISNRLLAVSYTHLDVYKRQGWRRWPAKSSPTASSTAFATIRPIAARPATAACGATRAIPTISSNGAIGSATSRWPGARPWPGWRGSAPY